MKTLAKTMFVLLILMAGGLSMLGQTTFPVHCIKPLVASFSDMQSKIEPSAELIASTYHIYMEEQVPLESWMLHPFTNVSQEWDFLVEAIEEPIAVRKWMICCADWNLKTMQGSWLSIPVISLE
jgi:hypothetical protein